jgi:hypothetical protein
MELLPD